ncbi:S41 family peptidase [Pedobacter sp. Hv1]|uniref:S41 family peptidase n=1 Tax=Pedobacter sp. Hv1 TaxID=1740090 RepID=UPI0006D8AE8E|nr:S41 family peptidase [Pedobacter sp. Hv1]KQC00818.1 hypothetical protein AQF98_09065 [Pedobacter sp. Hv1]
MKKLFKTFLYGTLLLMVTNTFAQRTIGDKYADSVQRIRNNVRKIWIDQKKPTPTELEKSIEQLKSALTYLDQTEVKDVAQGSSYLYNRKSDVYSSLLEMYTLNKQYDKAIDAFEKAYENAKWDRSGIEKDTIYKELVKLPKFITLTEKYKARAALWKGDIFKTPYKPNLSDEEKVAGLSQLWAQAKYNFVYLDRLTTDWNKTYLAYLPLVKATKSTKEYYRVLQQFYAQLHDGHTDVFPPAELVREFYAKPPVRTELIEGRVFITSVSSDSLQQNGIVPGLEILKIDGEPVMSYADKYIKPYLNSSTLQDLIARQFSTYLLRGDEFTPISLELKDKKGKVWTTTLNRSGYKNLKKVPAMEFKTIGDIGYLTINSFNDESILKKYDSLFTTIANTKSLIIDVRDNGGGEGAYGEYILRTLANQTFNLAKGSTIRYEGQPVPGTNWVTRSMGSTAPNKKNHYDKPIVLLIGPNTYSAAEDFTMQFDAMQRGKLIGLPTGGSTGQPFSFDLPGGGSARVCAKKDTYPDGKEFVGIGIIPAITVTPTIKGLFEGKDETLMRALEFLSQK